jgi:hypothetical protein
MEARRMTFRSAGLFAIAAAVMLACGIASGGEARAQTGAPAAPAPGAPAAPATTIAPPEGTTEVPAPAPTRAPAVKHTARRRVTAEEVSIEPGHAHLRLKEDAWAYSRPSKWSNHVQRVHAGKFINVTGSTKYYLRVQLKSGKTGYVSQSAVDLVKPADKIFTLTMDTPVLDKPNRWGKKVAEVHRGHGVHVIGVALNYMKIKMKSGLEGYIPMTALE